MTVGYTLNTLAAAVIAQAGTVATVYDGNPPAASDLTVPSRYVIVYEGTGNGLLEFYASRYARRRVTYLVVCVARTPSGVRDLVATVATALQGWIPPAGGAEQLHEVSTGPVLTDGAEGDRRLSVTVEYATHLTPPPVTRTDLGD